MGYWWEFWLGGIIFRGDTPFCSEDCRQEQIASDEAKEKKLNLSSSVKALRKKQQRESTSPNKTQNYPFRTGTIAAAWIYLKKRKKKRNFRNVLPEKKDKKKKYICFVF